MSYGKSGTVTKAPRLDAAGEAAVVAAIKRAERGNRGEVRVHLEARAPGGDALARAEQLFRALGVHRTKDGTGVLLYVAVDDRKAAVFAGPGVHGAQGVTFWQGVTDAVAAEAREGRLAAGLVAALDLVGAALRERVAGDDRHGNELPDAVSSS
jgi:uncharacterized membrane protein